MSVGSVRTSSLSRLSEKSERDLPPNERENDFWVACQYVAVVLCWSQLWQQTSCDFYQAAGVLAVCCMLSVSALMSSILRFLFAHQQTVIIITVIWRHNHTLAQVQPVALDGNVLTLQRFLDSNLWTLMILMLLLNLAKSSFLVTTILEQVITGWRTETGRNLI